ncbi:hypothetical protein ACIQ6V_12235 [Streptomyces sp. NPDC096198]
MSRANELLVGEQRPPAVREIYPAEKQALGARTLTVALLLR